MAILALALAIGIPLMGCEDTKARQENLQLKGQIVDLQKENTNLSSQIDNSTKDNASLREENDKLKARTQTAKKSSKAKKHKKARRRSTSATN